MFYPKIHEQTILEILRGFRGYISATADSVLTDPPANEHIQFPVLGLERTNTGPVMYGCRPNKT